MIRNHAIRDHGNGFRALQMLRKDNKMKILGNRKKMRPSNNKGVSHSFVSALFEDYNGLVTATKPRWEESWKTLHSNLCFEQIDWPQNLTQSLQPTLSSKPAPSKSIANLPSPIMECLKSPRMQRKRRSRLRLRHRMHGKSFKASKTFRSSHKHITNTTMHSSHQSLSIMKSRFKREKARRRGGESSVFENIARRPFTHSKRVWPYSAPALRAP